MLLLLAEKTDVPNKKRPQRGAVSVDDLSNHAAATHSNGGTAVDNNLFDESVHIQPRCALAFDVAVDEVAIKMRKGIAGKSSRLGSEFFDVKFVALDLGADGALAHAFCEHGLHLQQPAHGIK